VNGSQRLFGAAALRGALMESLIKLDRATR
jgi:hypothetical protein